MTLKDGKTGMTLKILKIDESDLKQRMMTMGLIPGTKVKILRSAPLGDPIAIGVRSYNLALRARMRRRYRFSRSTEWRKGDASFYVNISSSTYRQSEYRQVHHFQRTDWCTPEDRQLAGRHGR